MSSDMHYWLSTPAHTHNSLHETTTEEALLDFFYNGVSPWISSRGYSWIRESGVIAGKFLEFCHAVDCAIKEGESIRLLAPKPKHRDLPEDRDTFECFADIPSFVDMLSRWECRHEIVGTRFDYMIRGFCYIWVDVERGSPARWTNATLDMNEEIASDDERGTGLPDGNWSRRKHDLY